MQRITRVHIAVELGMLCEIAPLFGVMRARGQHLCACEYHGYSSTIFFPGVCLSIRHDQIPSLGRSGLSVKRIGTTQRDRHSLERCSHECPWDEKNAVDFSFIGIGGAQR